MDPMGHGITRLPRSSYVASFQAAATEEQLRGVATVVAIAPLLGKMMTLIPSGKLLHNYGKSPFLMGKLTINGHFQ